MISTSGDENHSFSALDNKCNKSISVWFCTACV